MLFYITAYEDKRFQIIKPNLIGVFYFDKCTPFAANMYSNTTKKSCCIEYNIFEDKLIFHLKRRNNGFS